MAEMTRLTRNGTETGTLHRTEDGKARLETGNKELREFFDSGTEFMPPELSPPEGVVGVMIPVPVRDLRFEMVLLSLETHGLIDPGHVRRLSSRERSVT